MRLLLRNAFKGLRYKKVQMIGIILLVMLSVGIYTSMHTAVDTLEHSYYDYLDEMNVEHASLAIDINYETYFSKEEIDSFLDNELKDAKAEEKMFMEYYKNNMDSLAAKDTFYLDAIFHKYGLLDSIEREKFDELSEKYNFEYELERTKLLKDGDITAKIVLYDPEGNINNTYITEGSLPLNEGEVVLLEAFANYYEIKVGDTYSFAGSDYKVSGLALFSDYIYPLITINNPLYDVRKNNILLVSEPDYNKIDGLTDNSWALLGLGDVNRKYDMSTFGQVNVVEEGFYGIFNDENVVGDMNTGVRMSRIAALQLEFVSNRLTADYFMYLLLTISVVVISVITKKRIDDERLQIGVLKSLGYNKYIIALSYLVYPIVGSLIGSTLGFIIGTLSAKPLTGVYLSFYNVPLKEYGVNLDYLANSYLIPIIFLSLLCYIIAIIMLRKKPLKLLKEGTNLKVNIFSKAANKITSIFPFEYKFKYSLAFRSMGKLLLIFLTSFLTGLLIVLTLIGNNLFSNVIEKSFEGSKYKYQAYTDAPLEVKDESGDSEYVLTVTLPITEINGEAVKEDMKDKNVTINGISEESQLIEIKNDSEEIINDKVKNGIVINKNVEENFGVKVGDVILFEYENFKFELEVTEVCAEYAGYAGYSNRSLISSLMGYENDMYSVVYSNDDKYNSLTNLSDEEKENIVFVLNIDDLKSNMEDMMARFSGSIYFVIAFASIMALIIIAVIANIVVEENKRTISLMKVMGYKDRKISNIVLNIYTPMIVIGYLLSIPVMKSILRKIIDVLAGDMDIAIPIELSWSLALLGLAGLLVAYYIAVAIAKKSLEKVPLAIALKRE